MKLIINKKALNINPERFLRRSGYGFITDRRRGTESFVRRLGNDFYPRFHMYLKEDGDKIVFNLHLDQKQPSYKGSHAHNAEYSGEVVQSEINRLKGLLKHESLDPGSIVGKEEEELKDPLLKMDQGEYEKEALEEKKSWWQKFFS